jgi:hypothetical protein
MKTMKKLFPIFLSTFLVLLVAGSVAAPTSMSGSFVECGW